MDLTYIYRIFHPKAVKYTFFLRCTWDILQERSQHGSQSQPLVNLRKLQLYESFFLTKMLLDINYQKKTVRPPANTWRLNNTLLNNQEITKKSKRKSKNTYKQVTMKTWQPKTYGMQQKQFYEECLEQYNSTSRNKKNMIKWSLSQGCKDSSTYVNPSMW